MSRVAGADAFITKGIIDTDTSLRLKHRNARTYRENAGILGQDM